MESFIKADIFFFISSLATIVLAVLVSFLLYYLIKAGKNLYMLTEMLKSNLKDSEEFVAELKERLENNIFFRLFFPLPKKSRRKGEKSGNIKNSR
ncbi:MAG: hypothetical protein AAB738_03670 [Patescibacteria group bacterium]